MTRIFYSFILFVLLTGSAFAQPWLGTYDTDPEYYQNNSHHTTAFILLSNSEYHNFGEPFANYLDGSKYHYFHDHTFVTDGKSITIFCWEDFGNYDKPDGGRKKVDSVSGLFNDDQTEISIGELTFYKVSNKFGFPGSPGAIGD